MERLVFSLIFLPFRRFQQNSVPADVAACVAKGKTQFISNNCGDLDDDGNARVWGVASTKALQGGYSVSIADDANYLAQPSADAATADDGVKDLADGENDKTVFDWELGVTGVPAAATDLFVARNDGFKQSVSIVNDKISLQNVPRSVVNLQLKAYELLQTCQRTWSHWMILLFKSILRTVLEEKRLR